MSRAKKLALLFFLIGVLGGIAFVIWYEMLPPSTVCGEFSNPIAMGYPSIGSFIFYLAPGLVFIFTGLGTLFTIKNPALRVILSIIVATLCSVLILVAIFGKNFLCT